VFCLPACWLNGPACEATSILFSVGRTLIKGPFSVDIGAVASSSRRLEEETSLC